MCNLGLEQPIFLIAFLHNLLWMKKMPSLCKTYKETLIFAAKISRRKFRDENFVFLEQCRMSIN